MTTKRHLWIGALALTILTTGPAIAQVPQVADRVQVPEVQQAPLDGLDPGSAGLIPARSSGFPETLWRASDVDDLNALIAASTPAVPALKALMRSLMLAEAFPPQGISAGSRHLGARLDWLVAHGNVTEAQALLELVGHDTQDLFQRWADLSLLLGHSGPLCAEVLNRPDLTPSMGLQIYCSAQSGDWTRAAVLYQTAAVLDGLPKRQIPMLERFLGLDDDTPPPMPPVRPSVLEFRLYEAMGEPLPSASLPLSFAVLDLSGDYGWKAQLQSAERLAHAGAISDNQLLGLYALRRPAASGGVWDRAAAVQALDRALDEGHRDRIEAALDRLWPLAANAGLLVQVSRLFADRLSEHDLTGRAATKAFRAGLLSPEYEVFSTRANPAPGTTRGSQDTFLIAIAQGAAAPPDADLPHAVPVSLAFAGRPVRPSLQAKLDQGRLGEVILEAMALFSSGADGDEVDLADALATFRQVGLEDVARRAALELMILDAERARR